MKKRFRTWLTSIMAGISALSLVGGTISTLTDKTASAATELRVIKPYIEYTFDNAQNFYGNTGTSASDSTKDYTLKKASATADIQRDGYVEFAKNDMLYLPMGANNGKNPFANGELQNFTFAVDVNATWDNSDGSWFRTLFAMDSFTAYSNDATSTELEKYCRIEAKAFYGTEWFRSGLKGLTPNKEQFKTYSEGAIVYGDVAGTTTGSLTIVFSYEAGNTLKIKTYKDKQQVGSVSLELNGWTIYNAESAYKTFTLGGCYDTRFIQSIDDSNNVTLSGFAGKFAGAMDNVRIYDFAMTEKQMAEYATNKKVETEVEIEDPEVPTYTAQISPYIEYTFDNAQNFYGNTGTSASDSKKDYTLKKASSTADIQRNGYVEFVKNDMLYLPMGENNSKNPFANGELQNFTFAVDVNATWDKVDESWFRTLFALDSFTAYGENTELEKYCRIESKAFYGTEWFRSGLKGLTPNKEQYKTYSEGEIVYGDVAGTTTGSLTIVFSYESGNTLKIKTYKDKQQVASISRELNGWTVYNATSAYKTFTLGGCYDTRFIKSIDDSNNVTLSGFAGKFMGTMDNIRIYDFAMTETQMAEYAINKSISTAGVQIAKSEGGKVTVNDYTPAVGEEVILNVTPDKGYEVDQVLVNGKAIVAENGVYKTEMVASGLYVEATFSANLETRLTNAVGMAHGAAVRYGGTASYSGLRFQITADKADYEGLNLPDNAQVRYGILVVPAEYQATYGAFTAENFFSASAKYHLAERDAEGNLVAYNGSLPQIMNFWTSELFFNEKTNAYEYFGSITKLQESNLTRQFVGVGVIECTVDGETSYYMVNYANNDITNNTRSIYQVAKLAVMDEKLDETARPWIQANYIDKVEKKVTALAGKKLSIIGDSISTFQGVSNNANANTTIGGNAVFYKDQLGVNDTWWMQTANNTGMNVLVNNSWSGSNVAVFADNTLTSKAGCGDRAINLHDDINNVNPDVIAAYIGINDCGSFASVGNFDEISDIWNGEQYVGDFTLFSHAYARMVHQMLTKYDGAVVFLFTLPRNGFTYEGMPGTKAEYNVLLDSYNKMIYKIAEVFGCQVVDLATSVGENYNKYLLNDAIHPNATGMDIITATFETALYSYYAKA